MGLRLRVNGFRGLGFRVYGVGFRDWGPMGLSQKRALLRDPKDI